MIFPDECKVIGNASTKPLGDKVYFLTEYLIHPTENGTEVLKVRTKPGTGIMRDIECVEQISAPEDTVFWDEEILTPHNRADLVKKALSTGKRCTIFGKEDGHMTFVLDPDLSDFLEIHVYDIIPPRPTLSAALEELERIGYFEKDRICFSHHITDISKIEGDVYPCRAGGFAKTLDRDVLLPGEKIVCCTTGRQITHECYGDEYTFEETCPLAYVDAEPFIARCCRIERKGVRTVNGKLGVVVHWAANAKEIAKAIDELLGVWRKG